ncbi:recombinase family protein [Sinanaerobacter sp. ZZT-01]|uniref:recombinase family protein n=1 Tax=Sinanaerobacter sp. ZZT-01 TaxID=3111540 RepID=UPI002D7654D9|nr:recombinase family protein [Sinanaerobacter sp. ZZT-01]WRR92661.1 recombinase family protein [Sinanaerobacter sp. ZZT-01]
MSVKPIKVTLYYRVSTTAEAQEESFKNQPKFFKLLLGTPEYKKTHKAVEKLYCDYGLSGTKLNRDGFNKMLEDAGLVVKIDEGAIIPHPLYPDRKIKQNTYTTYVDPNKKPKFEEIWCKTTSRWARNINAYDIICTLRLAQVYVFFSDQKLTSRNISHLPLIRNRLNEDMAYSEQVSRTQEIALLQYIDENRVRGKTYGYIYHKKEEDRLPYYTIDPIEGPAVQKIFQWCVDGLGYQSISNELAKRKIFAPKTGEPFNTSSISKILHNEKYKGFNISGKYTTGPLFEKLNSATIRKDYKERLKETADLPAIVTPELWDKAQKAMEKRRTTPESKIGLNLPSHPFKDLLRCGTCGNHFVYDNNNGRGFFKCSTKATKGASVCNCNNLFQYQLDAFLERLMNEDLHGLIITDYENTIISLITLCEGYLNRLKNPSALDNAELQELNLKLQSKLAGRNKLLDLLSSGEYDPEQEKDFDIRIKSVDSEIKALKFGISQLETPTSDMIEKLNELFNCIFSEFKIVENKKEKYTKEEVLNLLSQIQVFGKTENMLGGKTPDVILIPIIQTTEMAQGLILAGYSEFAYKFRNKLPDYFAPETYTEKIRHGKVIKQESSPIHPFDDPNLSEAERYDLLDKTTKSQWPTGQSKYILNSNAFYTQTGELGYVSELGFENISIMQQIKDYAQKLYDEFLQVKEQNNY